MRGDKRTSYIQVCSFVTLTFTYKWSFQHGALQAARTSVRLSKTTTCAEKQRIRTCACVLRAPAQQRRENYGLLIAQPWEDVFRPDFLTANTHPGTSFDGEMMNPTEPVRAAVCAYAVGVGKPMRPSPKVIRLSSKRQVVILSFVLSSQTNT